MGQVISTTDDLLALFTDRLTAVGGHVHVAAGSEDAARAIQTIDAKRSGGTAWASLEVIQRAPSLVSWLAYLGLAARVPADPAEVRDQPLGIAIAEGTVAETGSSIMSEPRLDSRSVTLMTETLVIVCPTSRLLPSLDEAAPVLREIAAHGASYATFITGPSRTADIERQLTVGVQGPGEFHVILVDQLS
jgi:L-lactate dehydrogenase complex protein LldG